MKKIAVVIIVFIGLLYAFTSNKQFSLLDYFSGEYTCYTSSMEDDNALNLGFCYMNSKVVKDGVVGESIVINNLEVASAIKVLNARVIKTECLEDGTVVIYAHTNLIDKKIVVDNKLVNLQIATRDDRSVIGWPLILGSF